MLHGNASVASRGAIQRKTSIAFLTLTWIFTVLRTWTRMLLLANFGWDDATMILANLIFTIDCASMLVIDAHGGGTHVTELKLQAYLIKFTILGEITYTLTIMVLKISLGIFFRRIVVKTWQQNMIYVMIAFSTASSLINIFYIPFRCGPNVDRYLAHQLLSQCASRQLDLFFTYQNAAITTLTDWTFATLPIALLWNANLSTHSKLSVGFILSLGAVGSICSMVRFKYASGLTEVDDFYWNSTNAAIWSTIEPGIGIIAGCLATLRPFLRKVFSKAMSISSSASDSAKRMSRSFRSNSLSATKSDNNKGCSSTHNSESLQSKKTTSKFSNGNNSVEMTPVGGENCKSTEKILEDTPWPSQNINRRDSHDTDDDVEFQVYLQPPCAIASSRSCKPRLSRRESLQGPVAAISLEVHPREGDDNV